MGGIGTWNMQGSSNSTEQKWNLGVRGLLTQLGLEELCLQECGSVPGSAVSLDTAFSQEPGLYRWGTARAHVFILFLQTDANGNRCNLAIVSRSAPTAGLVVCPAGPPTSRPALGALVHGVWFFNLHAISPGGPDVEGLLAGIVAAVGGTPAAPWVALGHYNREPTTAPGGDWHVCPPNGYTYRMQAAARQLDYMTVSSQIAPVVGETQGMEMSDHYPVLFDFPWPEPVGDPTAAANLRHLAQLEELKAAGILTDAEFQTKKATILRS